LVLSISLLSPGSTLLVCHHVPVDQSKQSSKWPTEGIPDDPMWQLWRRTHDDSPIFTWYFGRALFC
jgi:hypothetical protein